MVQDEDLDWAEDLESGDSIADAVSAAFRRGIARWQRLGLRPEHVVTRWEDGLLTMIVDIDDEDRRCIVRTLRADFAGARVLIGRDPTGQWVTPLIEGEDGVRCHDVRGKTPEEIGALMVGLFEVEIIRPIYREEWDDNQFHRWVLGDTGEELVWGSLTKRRPDQVGVPQRRIQLRRPYTPASPR